MSGNITFGAGVPTGAAWIGPNYAALLEQIKTGQSPYLFLIDIVHRLYHPAVPTGFHTQLYAQLGLFAICALLILLGLIVRLLQGRLWIFHRLDSTVVLPNASTLFGLCALVFVGLGFWLIISTIEISQGADLPRYYTGLRIAWFGAIWTGAFFEIWTTVAGWYVRKFGTHYRESRLRSFVALSIPVTVFIVAWLPPLVLCVPHAQKYNRSFRISQEITTTLWRWQRTWRFGDGLDMTKLLTLFTPGAELGNELIGSHRLSRVCSWFCTCVLFITFVIYVLAASLEISQLGKTVRHLQVQAAQQIEQVREIPAVPSKPDSPRLSAGLNLPELAFRHNPTPAALHPSERPATLAAKCGRHRRDEDEGALPSWALLAWVRRNRVYSAACIAVMLLAQAAVDLWRALAPLNLQYPSSRFQVEILVSCWIHGILATTVSLLLLFRSFDASSSRLLRRLERACPWLPFPPSVTDTASKSITSDDEPPIYHAQTPSGDTIPLTPYPVTLESPSSVDKHPYAASLPLESVPSFPSVSATVDPHVTFDANSSSSYLHAVEHARARWLPSRSSDP